MTKSKKRDIFCTIHVTFTHWATTRHPGDSKFIYLLIPAPSSLLSFFSPFFLFLSFFIIYSFTSFTVFFCFNLSYYSQHAFSRYLHQVRFRNRYAATAFPRLKLTSFPAYSLQVDSSKTIAHIKALLKEQDASIHPTASSLVYAGKSLDDSKTLEECNIVNDSTLHYSSGNSATTVDSTAIDISSAVKTAVAKSATTSSAAAPSAPPRKSRKRCSAKNCISLPLRNVGDCSFCEGHFCSRHRLLEQHQCVGLKNCKEQLHE